MEGKNFEKKKERRMKEKNGTMEKEEEKQGMPLYSNPKIPKA